MNNELDSGGAAPSLELSELDLEELALDAVDTSLPGGCFSSISSASTFSSAGSCGGCVNCWSSVACAS